MADGDGTVNDFAFEKAHRVNFYPRDFIAGIAGLKIGPVNLGVYFAFIMLCYESGQPSLPEDVAAERIASLLGCNPRTVRAALADLERLSKLTRITRESPSNDSRMVVELEANRVRKELEEVSKRIRINRESASNGGAASRKNKGLSQANAPRTNKQTLSGSEALESVSVSESESVTPHTPQGGVGADAPVGVGSPPPRPSSKKGQARPYNDHPDFQRFYAAYPRAADKGAAFDSWLAALKRGQATAQELVIAAQRFAQAMRDENRPHDKIKHPATWLNQDSFLDFVRTPPPEPGGAPRNPNGGAPRPGFDVPFSKSQLAG